MLGVLDTNPVFEVLNREVVGRRAVGLGEPVALEVAFRWSCSPRPAKTPLYLETDDAPSHHPRRRDRGRGSERRRAERSLFVPGCAAMTPGHRGREWPRRRWCSSTSTLWRDDEMILQEIAGAKTSRRMGHMSLQRTRRGDSRRWRMSRTLGRIMIHISNANPVLLEDSPERAGGRARRLDSGVGRPGDRPSLTSPSCSLRTASRRRPCATSAHAATTSSTRSTGCCTPASSIAERVQAWALNRYYYQNQIPIKDAVMISRLSSGALRREVATPA